MLTVSKMAGGGHASYYLELAREDYYLEGGEPLGKWYGELAESLKLTGNVKREELRSLLAGLNPSTGESLVQQQNWKNRKRTPGWDLTFSAPKSISVLWAVADRNTRHAIQAAHESAIKAALGYIQDQAGYCRIGKGGTELQKCKLAFALFEHGTSRALDMQLHTHVLGPNAGRCEDGKTRAVFSRGFYQHKMAAGALYRTQLAFELKKSLGLALEADGRFFKASIVSKPIEEFFSTRRSQIKQHLESVGFTSAKAAEVANLETRQIKQHVSRRELFHEWGKVTGELGLTQKQISAHLGTSSLIAQELQVTAAKLACTEALKRLENTTTTFSRKDLVRFTAEQAQHVGVPIDYVSYAVNAALNDQRQAIRINNPDPKQIQYTTPAALELEKRIDQLAEQSIGDRSHVLSSTAVAEAIKAVEGELRAKHFDPTISFLSEQTNAVSHVTEKPGSIQTIQGHAGSGKTTLLKAARIAWESKGYTVLGGTLSARAAKELQNESGIKSDTLAMLALKLSQPGTKLNKKTVLVIDEAGMVGSKDVSFFLQAARDAGAKVVLVGDTQQLQPIDPGPAFYQVQDKVGSAELKENRRQYELWEQKALKDVRQGDATQALHSYLAAERLHIEKDSDATRAALVSKWNEERTKDLSKTLVLAGTNEEVSDLNRLVQEKRFFQRELGKSSTVHGQKLYENDRILFLKTNRKLELNNGDRGTITAIDTTKPQPVITVAVDGPNHSRLVTFTPDEYPDISLGYAVTTHKAQGATCDRAFVLGNPAMQDKYLSYVQLSRAREQTRIFVTEEQAGYDLSALGNAMKRETQQQLIREHQLEQEESIALTLEYKQ